MEEGVVRNFFLLRTQQAANLRRRQEEQLSMLRLLQPRKRAIPLQTQPMAKRRNSGTQVTLERRTRDSMPVVPLPITENRDSTKLDINSDGNTHSPRVHSTESVPALLKTSERKSRPSKTTSLNSGLPGSPRGWLGRSRSDSDDSQHSASSGSSGMHSESHETAPLTPHALSGVVVHFLNFVCSRCTNADSSANSETKAAQSNRRNATLRCGCSTVHAVAASNFDAWFAEISRRHKLHAHAATATSALDHDCEAVRAAREIASCANSAPSMGAFLSQQRTQRAVTRLVTKESKWDAVSSYTDEDTSESSDGSDTEQMPTLTHHDQLEPRSTSSTSAADTRLRRLCLLSQQCQAESLQLRRADKRSFESTPTKLPATAPSASSSTPADRPVTGTD
ncbi:MAG: hypothetical protein MHM6MM_000183 [Cercozoa sp. M6MM]